MSDEQGAIPEARAHKMAPGGYGHGLSHCEYCKATDREIAFALGPICPNAPTPAADRFTDTGDAAEIIREMVRLADMGFEESLREPEENGNYAVYERAKRYLAATPKPPVDAGAMKAAKRVAYAWTEVVAQFGGYMQDGWNGEYPERIEMDAAVADLSRNLSDDGEMI